MKLQQDALFEDDVACFPMCVTCPAHHTLFELITNNIIGGVKTWDSPLCFVSWFGLVWFVASYTRYQSPDSTASNGGMNNER
jgi:hypothetical protein